MDMSDFCKKSIKKDLKGLVREYGCDVIYKLMDEIRQEPKLPDDIRKLRDWVGENEYWKSECFYYAVVDGENETLLIFVTKWDWFYGDIPRDIPFRFNVLPDLGEFEAEEGLFIYDDIKDNFREMLAKAGFEENPDMLDEIKKTYNLRR